MMPKAQTIEEENQDTNVDSNVDDTPVVKGKTGSDPSSLPIEEDDASVKDIMTSKEVQNEFFKDMADFKDEMDEEDFVEGGEVKKAPVAKTPAEVAAEALAAQSELEASNVAKGLNADGTPKAPQPDASTTPQPELDAEGKPIVTPPVVQAQPTPQPPAAGTEPTGEKPPTPEEIVEYYRNWRGGTEKVLAETHYKLSQEQVDELDADPVAALPKFMAKVYLDAVTASLAQMNAHLPRMVQQINAASKESSKREDKFYEKWPALNTEDHQKVVLRLGSAYKLSNPGATVDEFINEVGAQAMVTLRLPMPAQANGSTPAVPAKPFKPAASTPPSTGAAPPPKNPFEAFNETFDEDIDEE